MSANIDRKVCSIPLRVTCALATCAAVAVGSLTPFSFDTPIGGMVDGFGLGRILWYPSPVHDLITNFAVYIPVGLLLAVALKPLVRSRIGTVTLASVVGLSVSFTMEWMQTMMSVRYASWVDVCMNFSGAGFGALLILCDRPVSAVCQRVRGAWRMSPWSTATVAVAIGLMGFHLMPFDFVSSNLEWQRSLAQSNFWPIVGSNAIPVDSAGDLISLASHAAPFVAFGALLVLANVERVRRGRGDVGTVISGIVLVPLAIELTQVFVISHAFGLVDWLVACAGGCVGATGCAVFHSRFCNVPFRRLAVAGAVVHVILLVTSSAAPFNLAWKHADVARIVVIPLAGQWTRPFGPAVADLVSCGIAFLVLACLLRIAFWGWRSPYDQLVVFAIVVLVAMTCEFIRWLSPSRFLDVTPLIIAGAAAWMAARLPLASLSRLRTVRLTSHNNAG